MAKVKLLKAFTHHGITYNVGDDFEGTEAEIADLVRQGYVKDANAKDANAKDDKGDAPPEKPAHK